MWSCIHDHVLLYDQPPTHQPSSHPHIYSYHISSHLLTSTINHHASTHTCVRSLCISSSRVAIMDSSVAGSCCMHSWWLGCDSAVAPCVVAYMGYEYENYTCTTPHTAGYTPPYTSNVTANAVVQQQLADTTTCISCTRMISSCSALFSLSSRACSARNASDCGCGVSGMFEPAQQVVQPQYSTARLQQKYPHHHHPNTHTLRKSCSVSALRDARVVCRAVAASRAAITSYTNRAMSGADV